jgi:valyl-tRNA synthetase
MPFLTEELWQRLPRRHGDETPSIMSARYPKFDGTFVDEAARTDYDSLLEICAAVRSLVATYSVTSGAVLSCAVYDESGRQTARAHLESVKVLTGKEVEIITILDAGHPVPEGCVMQDTGKATVFLHVLGHVNVAKELEKTRSKLAGILQNVARSQKTVAGLQSSDKAADKALAAEQAKLADHEKELQTMTKVFHQFERLTYQAHPVGE